MVAHDFANTSLLGPVRTIYKTFFERNVPFIIVFSGPGIAPVNKFEMKPCSAMATLIGWTWTKGFARNGKKRRACSLSKIDQNPVV